MDRSAPKQRLGELIRRYKAPALVVLLGLMLLLLPGKQPEKEAVATQPKCETLEERLEEILSELSGAGEVRVLLTEQSGPETLYQTDSSVQSDESGSSRSEDTVLLDRAEALVRQTLEPVYRGAIVLCEGADSAAVRLAVVEAVSAVTGLRADQISVLKMQ